MKKTRVLIECHSLLGDLVLMTPMIKKMKMSRPDILIDVVVASKVEKDILSLMGNFVHEYFFFQPSNMKKVELLKMIFKLRKNHYTYGLVSVSEDPVKGAIFLKICGCRKQIGEVSKKSYLQYNCPVKQRGAVHRVERNAALLKAMNIDTKVDPITLSMPLELKEWALRKIKHVEKEKVIVLCLGTGDFVWKDKYGKQTKYNCKMWGYDKFADLTKRLLVQGYKVIWIGGEKEQKDIKDIMDQNRFNHSKLFNMTGKTNIKESLALISISDIVIGADTGLMHCAAALGKRTLCIIGATDPEKIRPYSRNSEIIYLGLPCSPCYGTEEAVYCKHHNCLSQITVDTVILRMQEIFKEI